MSHLSGTYNIRVYNDEPYDVVIRSIDNSSRAWMDRRMRSGETGTLSLPQDQPYIIVNRNSQGKADVRVTWAKSNDFQPRRDAPAIN